VAFVIAALWTLHPVQTASVTYISQRAESLMGLFYLLTLYAFVRRTDSAHPGRWDLLAIAACALGTACKEVMITAPVLVLLYDRTFISGSFRAAWRRHGRLYVGLAASWVLLGVQLAELRGQAVGWGLGVSWQGYALTEGQVVVRYLGLALWPHPLVFDYGEEMAQPSHQTVAYACVLLVLLAGTVMALRWRPVLGFLGGWFFVILAPTSSIVPIIHQPMAENRLYLPLAAVVAGAVAGIYLLSRRRAFPAIAALLIIGLGALTVHRNADYQSEIHLWRDTLAKRPANARAHYNLGHALAGSDRPADAAPEYEAAFRLRPDYAEAHHNLGNALAHLGRRQEAIAQYQEALRLKPAYPSAHYNLACTLVELDLLPDAIRHFEAALRLEPDAAGVHYNLGSALARVGRTDEAITHFAEAIRLSPAYPEAQTNWGNALARSRQWHDAIAHYEAALAINPDYAEAHINLGNALFQQQRTTEAVRHYETALRLQPGSAEGHYNLANLLLERNQLPEAIAHYEAALQFQPALVGAHHNLALALVRTGRAAEAVPHYEETLRLVPGSAAAHQNLAVTLAQLGRKAEAMAHDEAALRLQPDFPGARAHLVWLRNQ
jgi:tetratricopeptide (TPR) repeat protein